MRVEKDLTINAPVEKVYSMWTDFENFPTFMSRVLPESRVPSPSREALRRPGSRESR